MSFIRESIVNGTLMYDHNKQLVIVTVITLNAFHRTVLL